MIVGDNQHILVRLDPCDCDACRGALAAMLQMIGQKVAKGEMQHTHGRIEITVVEGKIAMEIECALGLKE